MQVIVWKHQGLRRGGSYCIFNPISARLCTSVCSVSRITMSVRTRLVVYQIVDILAEIPYILLIRIRLKELSMVGK
jgi:hypothetical protein